MPRPGPRRLRWAERSLALAAAVPGCAWPTPREPDPVAAGTRTAPREPEPQGELRGRLVAGAASPGGGLRWVCARPETAAPGALALPTLAWRRAADAFAPALLVASVGQGIQLLNDEPICHRFFTAQAPNASEWGMLRPGEAATLRFDQPGLVHVYCALHAGRQGSILVLPTPHVSRVAPSGEFVLTGLPAGPCVLEVWSASAAPWSVAVQVPRRGAGFVEIPVAPDGLAAEPGR